MISGYSSKRTSDDHDRVPGHGRAEWTTCQKHPVRFIALVSLREPDAFSPTASNRGVLTVMELAFSEPLSRRADILVSELNNALSARSDAFAAGRPKSQFHDYIRIGDNAPVGEPP
jgi:hypothetical protein